MGATRSELPDGRVVCIGGEHEDFYDPDFCIYNDVVVIDQDEITIYGYPKEIFPPTDFHSATLDGNLLVIVGGLGYKNERMFGSTPVYALDLLDFHIEKVETSGDMPGWIHRHEAQISEIRTLTVRGGRIVLEHHGKQQFLRNVGEYTLDLKSRIWRQTQGQDWYQAKIWRDDNQLLPLNPLFQVEALLPRTIPYTLLHCDRRQAEIVIEDVEVSIQIEVTEIEIVVHGSLSPEMLNRLSDDFVMNAQVLLQGKCNLQAF